MSLNENAKIIPLSGRIDSQNASQVEEEIFSVAMGDTLVLDAADLDYISSAGLRILLKLRKKVTNISLINVNRDVYDILEMTGFSSLFNVKKAMRSVSIEGCQPFSRNTADPVYRLDQETIVRVYSPDRSLEDVIKERQGARAALIAGLPTPIPFDTVQVGNCYGNTSELVDSPTLAQAFRSADSPEAYEELLQKYVNLVKEISSIQLPEGTYPQIKDLLKVRVDRLSDVFSPEDLALISRLLDSMKESPNFIHGSLRPSNILVRNGELLLVDLGEMACGSPIYEMTCLYRDLFAGPTKSPEYSEEANGLTAELALQIWNDFVKKYLGTEDPTQIKRYCDTLSLMEAINTILVLSMTPQDFKEKMAPALQQTIIKNMLQPYETTLNHLLANM